MKHRDIIFLALALSVFAGLSLLFFDKALVDDSFIGYRYADNLVRYGELNWNAGEHPPVEGYSNFLWLILLAGLAKLGANIIFASQVAGFLFGMGCIAMLYLLSRRLTRDSVFSFLPPLLLALTSPFAFWAVSGMETAMFMFFLLLSVYAFVCEWQAGKLRFFPIPFALTALVRHEGAVIFGSTLLFLFLLQLSNERAGWKSALPNLGKHLALFLVFYLPYFIWRVGYYQNIFPNSFHAKHSLFAGVGDILYGSIYMLPIILLALFILREESRMQPPASSAPLKLYFLVIIASLSAVLLNITTIMGLNFRFMLPAFPFFYLLMLPQGKVKQNLPMAAILLIVLLWTAGFGAFPYNTLQKNVISVAEADSRLMAKYELLGKRLGSLPDAISLTLAVGEAGIIPYYSRMRVIDLLALNDLHLSRHPDDSDYVLGRKPDIILLSCSAAAGCEGYFPIYTKLAQDERLQQDYFLVNFGSSFEVYFSRDKFGKNEGELEGLFAKG